MTAPTPDAVAQAREDIVEAQLYDCGNRECERPSDADRAAAERRVDALIAAVRAECADRVRALPGMEDDGSPGDWENYLRRGDVLAALEAQP